MKTEDCLKLIEKWIGYSGDEICAVPGREDLLCYGTGYNGWGVQTHQKAFAAAAILASMTDDKSLLDRAMRMLRFSLESHIEGSAACMDGDKWGHTWISALGTERMAPAVDLIMDRLSPADKALLEKVFVSEADWLLNEYPVIASPDNPSQNKPESNLWNGAFLHRVAMMFPECPGAAKYREKGSRFLMNSISVPSDRNMSGMIDGKKISEWHIGGNFQESYALVHHGYMNVGYMVVCLSNIALLHFSCKARGIEAPESLYHHALDLWALVKKLTYPDGRLLRIGGDTRVRYCYCQDYAVPSWLFIADKYGDSDALDFERRWLETVKKEFDYNGDGSFLGKRLGTLKERSPLYYTRTESDRAVTLALSALWHDKFELSAPAKKEKKTDGAALGWHDKFHGASFVRSEKSLRSWVWMASQNPFGLCLPPDDSSLAEWKFNCSGEIRGTGTGTGFNLISHRSLYFRGGFVTSGKFQVVSSGQLGEGQKDDIPAEEQIAFAALPDGVTILCMQYAKAPHRTYIKSVKGLMLPVPNDIFNGFNRAFSTPEKTFKLKGLEEPGTLSLNSKTVCVDGKLTVELIYGADSLVINRLSARQIFIKNKEAAGGNLYCEEICSKYFSGLRKYEAGELILDECFAVRCGPSASPMALDMAAAGLSPECRFAAVRGADGNAYGLAVNFGAETGAVHLKDALRVIEGGKTLRGALSLSAGEAKFLQFPGL